jgi:hypothetical protein
MELNSTNKDRSKVTLFVCFWVVGRNNEAQFADIETLDIVFA